MTRSKMAACSMVVVASMLALVGAARGREGQPELPAWIAERFAQQEREALDAGWYKETLIVNGVRRQLLWRGPEGAWAKGVIIALHGGGGTYADYASAGTDLGRPMVELAELARGSGFGIVSPDSTFNGATDGEGRACGKRWDCVASPTRDNVDLPFIRTIIDELLPELRPPGSGRDVFLAGISNGGFMTVLAASTMPGRITAFAPVSCGDPYGTYMDMGTHPPMERSHAPGVFRDNGTGQLISTPGAAGEPPYANEVPWPDHGVVELPAFMQLQHRGDGIVDFSLAVKARTMLVEHGFRDAGMFVLEGWPRSLWSHFWHSDYNEPMVEFFARAAHGPRRVTGRVSKVPDGPRGSRWMRDVPERRRGSGGFSSP